MKNNILKFGILALMFATILGCGDEDVLIFDTPNGFIQFASSADEASESSSDALVTTVLLGSGTNASGVTVNFSITSSDSSRYIITPSSGSLEIPAGEFSADITFMPIDNLIVDGNVEVVLELTASSSVPVGIGGEGINAITKTLTIIDDDCPVDINAFVGTFSVFENFTDGVNAPSGLNDFFLESYQLEISLMPGDATGTKVVINNSAGFNEYFPDGTVMTFQACPGTIAFDAGFPSVAAFATFEYDASSYDEGTGTIQCTGPLATFGPYQFTLTRM